MALFDSVGSGVGTVVNNLPYGGQYLPQVIRGAAGLAGAAGLGWAATGGPQRVADRAATRTGTIANNARALQRQAQDAGFSGNFWGGVADRNAARSDWYNNWYPGKAVNEGGPNNQHTPYIPTGQSGGGGITNAIGNGINQYRDTVGNYYGDPNSLNAWQTGINALAMNNANAANWMQPGQQSIGGQYYQGYETNAINNMQNAGNQTLGGVGGDIMGLRQGIVQQDQQLQSPLQQAINQRGLAAAQGGMSPQSQQQYQAIANQLDTAGQDSMNMINRGASQNLGLWGSGRLAQQNELALKTQQQKLTTMQSLMSGDYTQAINTAMQDKQLQNAALSIASDIYGKQAGNSLAANSAVLGHVQQAGQQYLQQTQLQLNQQFGNMEKDMNLLTQQGNYAQYMNNYNLQNRQLASNTATSLVNSIFGGGVLPYMSNEYWNTINAGQGGLQWTF